MKAQLETAMYSCGVSSDKTRSCILDYALDTCQADEAT